eukprot:gene10128-21952_t
MGAYGRTSFDATSAMLLSIGQMKDAILLQDRGYVETKAVDSVRSTGSTVGSFDGSGLRNQEWYE